MNFRRMHRHLWSWQELSSSDLACFWGGRTGLDELLDQPVLALELDIAGIDPCVEVIERTRGFKRLHTIVLLTPTLITRLLINHGHQCLHFQSGTPPLTQTI